MANYGRGWNNGYCSAGGVFDFGNDAQVGAALGRAAGAAERERRAKKAAEDAERARLAARAEAQGE